MWILDFTATNGDGTEALKGQYPKLQRLFYPNGNLFVKRKPNIFADVVKLFTFQAVKKNGMESKFNYFIAPNPLNRNFT